MNYVLLTGPIEGPQNLEGVYATEGELMDAVQIEEDRGLFCWAFALETPHYTTES